MVILNLFRHLMDVPDVPLHSTIIPMADPVMSVWIMIVLDRVTRHFFKSLWGVKSVLMIPAGKTIQLVLLFGWQLGEDLDEGYNNMQCSKI
jgi:hypothetical protein